jgi:hypothetical protein
LRTCSGGILPNRNETDWLFFLSRTFSTKLKMRDSIPVENFIAKQEIFEQNLPDSYRLRFEKKGDS